MNTLNNARNNKTINTSDHVVKYPPYNKKQMERYLYNIDIDILGLSILGRIYLQCKDKKMHVCVQTFYL